MRGTTASALYVVLFVAAAGVLSGCALTDRHVSLTYPPSTPAENAVAPAAAGTSVSLTVADARTGDRAVVGEVRNGFDMHTANVSTTDDAAAWVRRALETEFDAAGIRLVAPGPGTPALEARLVRLHCDAYFTYSAEVELDTTLSGAVGAAQSHRFTGSGGAGMNWSGTETSYGESLAMALRDAARQIANHVGSAAAAPVAARP